MQLLGLFAALLLVDRIGRRACLVLFLAATAAFLVPFFRPGGPTDGGPTDGVDVAMLFFTRMASYAAFLILFIYTPEVFPTVIRSYAFGVFNALARVGGLAAPFVGVDLFENVRRRSSPPASRERTGGTVAHVLRFANVAHTRSLRTCAVGINAPARLCRNGV